MIYGPLYLLPSSVFSWFIKSNTIYRFAVILSVFVRGWGWCWRRGYGV